MTVRITNIQHFCLQDGPGIRTTVFLKGCNLTCPWCCNPENISFEFQEYYQNNQKKKFGYDITLKELKKEILKDKIYYSLNNGGVTFSGGEPLLQIKDLEPLLKELKKEKINICFETSLQTSEELLKIALEYADEFFVDIKILEEEECEKILNGNVNLYYSNLNLLLKSDDIITFRIPLSKKFTLKENNLNLILEFLKKYSNHNVEIFKVHNLGEKKYKTLNKKVPYYDEIEEEEVEKIYKLINTIVKNCRIIKI